MTRTIEISIKDRIAWQTNCEEYICGNSDFVVHFAFDDEWEALTTKTARFVYGEQFTDVVFSGDICNIPVIADAHKMKVGVYAGNLRTTTAATVRCKKSILSGGGMVADPAPDVYAQIMEKLNDDKFLPERVKQVYIDSDGMGNYTASATYDEIYEWVCDGFEVIAYNEKYLMRLSMFSPRENFKTGYFVFYGIGMYCNIITVTIYEDGDVRMKTYGGIPM